MQTHKTGINGEDPAENQTPSYSAEVEFEGNEVNPWPYIHALLCSVSCVCLGRPNQQLIISRHRPSQACGDKVNTCIVALVVKTKL